MLGEAFEKNVDEKPVSGIKFSPGQLSDSYDLNNDGLTDIRNSFFDLNSAVFDGDAEIDAAHLLGRNDEQLTFVVSFADKESIDIGGSLLEVQDEDLVLVAWDGFSFSTSLFLDLTGSVAANVNVDALYVIDDTAVAVSFNRRFSTPQGRTADRADLVRVDFTDPNTIINISLFADIDLGGNPDLDAFTVLSDGSVIGSFSNTVNGIADHDLHLFTTSGLSLGLNSFTSSTMFRQNPSIDTNNNLIAVFQAAVPAPGAPFAAIGIAAAILLYRRNRACRWRASVPKTKTFTAGLAGRAS